MSRHELAFIEWAVEQGWTVTKQGWPDFICRRGDEVMAVEVKGPRDGLSRYQYETIRDLRQLGLPTYVWGPDTGMTEIGPVVGESVHSLRAIIAQLRRQLEERGIPQPAVPTFAPISWEPNLDEPSGVLALERTCLRRHVKWDDHVRYGVDRSLCAALYGMRGLPIEQAAAALGIESDRASRLLTSAEAFVVERLHRQFHTRVGQEACSYCVAHAPAA